FVYELRTKHTWGQIKVSLPALIQDAMARDGFLQVALDPVSTGDERAAYVTRHFADMRNLPQAESLFGSSGPSGPRESVPVLPERTPSQLQRDIGQAMCARELTPALSELAIALDAVGFLLLSQLPFGPLIAVAF